MKQWFQIICGVFTGWCLALIFMNVMESDAPPTSTLPPASVTVDASDSLTYRPVRALGDDWYLVEVAYPHTYKNPFPFGKAMMVMVVPHLVRMHASELDKLDKLDNPKK